MRFELVPDTYKHFFLHPSLNYKADTLPENIENAYQTTWQIELEPRPATSGAINLV